jgi:hypothetical protein
MMVQNKALLFNVIPDGFPISGEDLIIQTREFNLDQPPRKGGIPTKNHFASFDPYTRGRMRHADIESYIPALTLGQSLDPIRGCQCFCRGRAVHKLHRHHATEWPSTSGILTSHHTESRLSSYRSGASLPGGNSGSERLYPCELAANPDSVDHQAFTWSVTCPSGFHPRSPGTC